MTFTLEDLDSAIGQRASRLARRKLHRQLSSRGVEKCAKKLGEEATEAVIAAVTHNDGPNWPRKPATCSITSWCCCAPPRCRFGE